MTEDIRFEILAEMLAPTEEQFEETVDEDLPPGEKMRIAWQSGFLVAMQDKEKMLTDGKLWSDIADELNAGIS